MRTTLIKMETENNTISKKLLIFDSLLVGSIILMVFVIYGALNPEIKELEMGGGKAISKSFEDVKLIAKSAYVYDVVEDRVLYKKNEMVQLPLASITKLMMALTASEIAGKDSRIAVKKEFLESEGDSGLVPGENWKLSDLIDFSLMVSSNDGARSIASVVGAFNLKTNDYELGRDEFISKMNQTATRIGLKQTYFLNESGLDKGTIGGGYGSAADMAKLLQYILINQPELVEATRYPKVNIDSLNRTHQATNTNISINQIPGLLASKTGYTQMAGGNLVIAFDPSIGRPIVVVVLGSTEQGRFDDIALLVKATQNYLRE